MVKNIQYLPSLGKSDHITLLFDFNCYIESIQSSIRKSNFFKGDYVSMCDDLESLHWTEFWGSVTFPVPGTPLLNKLKN